MEAKAGYWKGFWQKEAERADALADAAATVRERALQEVPLREPVRPEELEAVIKRLRNGRGLGLDGWAPIELKQLPKQAVVELAEHTTAAENRVAAPVQ
eukprot:11226122-Lingulodinium_polyedra.AAC.1